MAPGRLLIRAGGCATALESADAAWLDVAAERFGGFETNDEPRWGFRYEVADGSPGAGTGDRLLLVDRPSGFSLLSPGFRADVDLESREVRVTGPRSIGALNLVLRYALPSLVADGLVLHGIGIVDGARGWVCAGPSGAGKSTLAGLAGDRAVCDELVAVRLVDGDWRLDALPFWKARPASLPLAGVCLLRHGPRQERTRLDKAAAFRAVGSNVLWPTYAPAEMEQRFSLLANFVDRVPAFDLAFAPTPDVLKELTRGFE
jgi:hypothetical protein